MGESNGLDLKLVVAVAAPSCQPDLQPTSSAELGILSHELSKYE